MLNMQSNAASELKERMENTYALSGHLPVILGLLDSIPVGLPTL